MTVSRRARWLRRAAILALLPTLAMPVGAQPRPGTTGAGGPTTIPAFGPMTRDQKVANLLDYLEREHGKKLVAPFWVSRAMGVITLARVPKETVTARLLQVAETDKHDVVRLLAWQAVIARAEHLDARMHARLIAATIALAEKDAMRGALRPTMLDVLATSVPTAKSRRIWMKVLEETNAWEPQDIATLDALGRTLAAWKSPQLVEGSAKLLTDPNHGVRAEYVLKSAGLDFIPARERLRPGVWISTNQDRAHPSFADLYKQIQTDVIATLQKNKATWREPTRLTGEPWKQLQPLFIPPPPALEDVDPDDQFWLADLELTAADVDQMEAVFVVDATGSMGDVLAWLRRDVGRVMQAMTLLSKEAPLLGVVFYRDRDAGFVTKVLPLTYKLADIAPTLEAMTADGGGDVPEAVADALKAAVQDMKWNVKSKRTGRVCVLVGDAPPKPGTEAECQAIAAKAKEMGIRLYTVKVSSPLARNDLATFDEIATAGGGQSTEINFQAISSNRFIGPDGREIPLPLVERPEAQLVVPSASVDAQAGERILVPVLVDAINPGYRDRVEPLAQTLLAHVNPRSAPEKRLGFPANTPPTGTTTFDPQMRR